LGLCTQLFAGATSTRSPFAFPFFDSCNNEFVDVSGTFHLVVNTSGDKTIFRLNAKGKGVGQDTGRKYEWNDNIHQTVDDPAGTEVSVKATQKLRLISHGKDLNLVLDVEFTFEVDADGNVTSTNVFVTNCRGADA
jgi:hypothetical protein